jgi:tetratricopeptide (TPR) repeat protein
VSEEREDQGEPLPELYIQYGMSKAEYDCGWAATPEERIEACTLFISIAETDQERAKGYNNRGRDRDGLGQTDLALEDLHRATELWPELGGPYLDRAMIWMYQGDAAAAIREYDALLELHPDEEAGLRSRCWARALAGTALDLALEDWDKAIRLSWSKARNYEDRAIIWLRRKEMSRVVRDADYALSLEPGRARALYLRGLGRVALGEMDLGQADIAAAKIASEAAVAFLARWGLKP